jgi:hypothetical protein
MVTGLAVLGSQAVMILNLHRLAEALWIASLALWVCVNYAVLFGVTVKGDKPAVPGRNQR